MFNRTFLLAILLVIALWFVVNYYERKRDQRKLNRIHKRLLKKEAANLSRDREDGSG